MDTKLKAHKISKNTFQCFRFCVQKLALLVKVFGQQNLSTARALNSVGENEFARLNTPHKLSARAVK
jgi:hypothetical protein